MKQDMLIAGLLLTLGGLIGGVIEYEVMMHRLTSLESGKATFVQCIAVLEKAEAAIADSDDALHGPAREIAEFLAAAKVDN